MSLTRKLREKLEDRGLLIKRLSVKQIIPEHIEDPECYSRPEDFGRLFKPWRSKKFDRVFTPEVVGNTMLSRMKLYYLHSMALLSQDVPGDFFEAGSGSGGSARLVLNFVLEKGIQRSMWLLDTFEGYKKVDPVRDGPHVKVDQCKCADEVHVRELVKNPTIATHVIKGLIPGTLEQVKTKQIAFAHIDVNLAEPTLAATEFCLERMPKGGVILFDDYGWPATYGARKSIEQAASKFGQSVIALPEQGFLVKR